MKPSYEKSPAKSPVKGAGIADTHRATLDAIKHNQETFTKEINAIIKSTSLTIDQKIGRIGAEIVQLTGMAGQRSATNREFINSVNTALKIDLKKADYIKAGKQYLAQQETAKELAQQETASVASSSTGLSKPAIALISLAVVAVGAAVVSYLTIPAAAIAMSTFASWITLQALPTAGLFLASKTGISALAITATVGLAVLALSYFSQSKSSTPLHTPIVNHIDPSQEEQSNEIVNSVTNNPVLRVVDANRAKEGVDTPRDENTVTL